MTTTPEDVLAILAGTEPDYVKELRAEVSLLREHLHKTNEVLSEWYYVVEATRKMLRAQAEVAAALDTRLNRPPELPPERLP